MANRVVELISPDLVSFSQLAFSGYESALPIYLHLDSTQHEVYGGYVTTQVINTLAMEPSFLQWLLSELALLDSIIDLDLYFQSDDNGTLIDVYLDTEISLGDSSTVLGLAVPNALESPWLDSHRWYEIFLNTPELDGDSAQLRYAVLHELGHAFGLEHPFDGLDGDSWGGQGGHPDGSITVMSYTEPAAGWTTTYTPMDYAALATIWGLEQDHIGLWEFDNADGPNSRLNTADATHRLQSIQFSDEQLLGRVAEPLAPTPAPLTPQVDELLPHQAPAAHGVIGQNTIFYAFAVDLPSESLLVEAFESAIATLDALLALNFRRLDDPTDSRLNWLLKRQSLAPEQLSAADQFGAVEWLGMQANISVDPLNPYYQNLAGYKEYGDYLEVATLQQLLLALGLQQPWRATGADASRFDQRDSLLALRSASPLDQVLLSPLDQQALLQLYLPHLALGELRLLEAPSSGVSRFELSLERPVVADLSTAVDVRVNLAPHSLTSDAVDPSLLHRSALITLPAGVTQAAYSFELPTGVVDQLQVSLLAPQQQQSFQGPQLLDLHAVELSLGLEHLIAAQPELVLQQQGSEQIFYSVDSNLPTSWRHSLRNLLADLDAGLDLEFIEASPNSELAQLQFNAAAAEQVVAHWRQPVVQVGEISHAAQPQLHLALPADALGSEFEQQQRAVLQQLLLALGLEHPSDARDGDAYGVTPVLPRDSALFNFDDGSVPVLRPTELDWQALQWLHGSDDDLLNGGDPLGGAQRLLNVPTVAAEILLNQSGLVGETTTSVKVLVRRSGNTQLRSRLLLVVVDPQHQLPAQLQAALQRELVFESGDTELELELAWPRGSLAELELQLHPLTALAFDPQQPHLSVEALLQLESRSQPTSNNMAPLALDVANRSILEFTPVGSVQLQLLATDADASSPLLFALVEGDGDADNSHFHIVDDRLILQELPDSARQSNYHVRLRATDEQGLFIEQAINLSVLDRVDQPLELSFDQPLLLYEPGDAVSLTLQADVHPDQLQQQLSQLSVFTDSSRLTLLHPASAASQAFEPWGEDPGFNIDLHHQLPLQAQPQELDPLSVDLMPLQLRTSPERFDPLMGDSTKLHTQVSDDLTGELIFSGTVKLTAFNLDVDGDGSVSLYTDGILLIRQLIGLQNPSQGFDNTVFSRPGVRSAAEIDSFLLQADQGGFLDFDGDGRTSLYTDGILMVRYLIAPELLMQSDELIGAGSPFAADPAALMQSLDALKPPPLLATQL